MYPDLLQLFKPIKQSHPHEPIRESVEALLNARAGTLPYTSSFGVPDFRDSISTDYADKLKKMVLTHIQHNEPRIKRVSCDCINTKKSLAATRYALQVTLKTEEQLDLSIETTGAGQFNVYL
ncbi:MAG: GPW/gp25 family protein [Gammaproteobacteria bacterium]